MNKSLLSKIILAVVDFGGIFFPFFLSLAALDMFIGNIDNYLPYEQFDNRIVIHLLLSIIGVTWFWIRLRHYTYRKPFWFELKEVLRTLIILAVIELAIIAFSKLDSSRFLWFFTWGFTLLFLPTLRIITKKLLIKRDWYKKDTIIIGSGKNAADAYRALKQESYLGLNILGYIQTNIKGIRSLDIPLLEYAKLWDIANPETTQFIIALENDESEERDIWLRKLAKHKARYVTVIPTLRGLPLYSTDMSFLFSHEVMLLRINNNLAKCSSRFLKRTTDIVGSIFIIIVLSPVLIVLYFLIKKDGGNSIYGHPRIGQNGKTFKCLKFRSMVTNSQEVLDKLLNDSPESRAEWEKDFKLKNDPRITKIGAFIRKTSLDELPQLFNVLKGEMSLVGPRPIVQEELERYEADVDYYLMAKPGMTGLWQVSGRNDVDYGTRIYFDAWYVKNWSLWNDIAILFKTVNVVLNRDGAY
ncbi:UDP-phosphate galactose phosphotransferase [Rodentibacter genomosp. 2]|uniref:undecaprenyl-phosphate galactose phosphotransferase WbaP n=1 Tax=Rodentibacter genomosp. 2 TaxID=1908266 RepID=UPI0009857BA4|nr:UDP-phosphate galactose phosphotransferase [Rodentibacter genomosp. 2]